MTIGAHPGGVEKVTAAFAEFAEAQSLSAAVRRSLSVALDELLANAISHGLAERDAGSVTIDAELGHERLTVTVTDDGPPFDPFVRTAPDTTMSIEDRAIGGLGIHLVRGLVDEVGYERRDGSNVVILVKKLVGDQTDGLPGGT